MKFSDKHANYKPGEETKDGLLVCIETSGCYMCSEPTIFVDLCYQAPFCSDECLAEFEKPLMEGREDDTI